MVGALTDGFDADDATRILQEAVRTHATDVWARERDGAWQLVHRHPELVGEVEDGGR